MEDNVNTADIYIQPIDKSIARDMIVKNHYSHAWTKCSVALGVFHRGKEHAFFDVTDDKLIGCIIYGDPVIRSDTHESISPLIKSDEIYELARLWIADGYGRNIESFVISKSFEWLKQNRPQIKILVSYADPSAGHLGRIYQATNWIFVDSFQAGNSLISFSNSPFEWIHPKTVFNTNKTSSPQQLADIKNSSIWAKRVPKKYKYLYILTGKIEKKRILKSLKYPPKPYPKENDYVEPEIKVFKPKKSKKKSALKA